MSKFRAASLTDIGRIRSENEDRLIFAEDSRLFGVADGVGGLPGGGEAAQEVAERVTAAVRAAPPDSDPDLRKIVILASDAVATLGLKISPGAGIGSTLTVGMIRGDRLTLAHVGDSRCYAWRAGIILRLTEDHSVENEARLRRAHGEVVYYNEAHRQALTRCIGQPSTLEVDIVVRPLQPGDRFVFCTDGVSKSVTDSEIRDLVGAAAEPAEAARELVGLAFKRGGTDNASVVAVYIDEV
jgi:serine/threonine protein phosphatase PrpC